MELLREEKKKRFSSRPRPLREGEGERYPRQYDKDWEHHHVTTTINCDRGWVPGPALLEKRGEETLLCCYYLIFKGGKRKKGPG